MFSRSSLCNSHHILLRHYHRKSFSWIGVGEVNPKSSIAFLDRFWKIELFESGRKKRKFCAKVR
jgi:hypothetical protein